MPPATPMASTPRWRLHSGEIETSVNSSFETLSVRLAEIGVLQRHNLHTCPVGDWWTAPGLTKDERDIREKTAGRIEKIIDNGLSKLSYSICAVKCLQGDLPWLIPTRYEESDEAYVAVLAAVALWWCEKPQDNRSDRCLREAIISLRFFATALDAFLGDMYKHATGELRIALDVLRLTGKLPSNEKTLVYASVIMKTKEYIDDLQLCALCQLPEADREGTRHIQTPSDTPVIPYQDYMAAPSTSLATSVGAVESDTGHEKDFATDERSFPFVHWNTEWKKQLQVCNLDLSQQYAWKWGSNRWSGSLKVDLPELGPYNDERLTWFYRRTASHSERDIALITERLFYDGQFWAVRLLDVVTETLSHLDTSPEVVQGLVSLCDRELEQRNPTARNWNLKQTTEWIKYILLHEHVQAIGPEYLSAELYSFFRRSYNHHSLEIGNPFRDIK